MLSKRGKVDQRLHKNIGSHHSRLKTSILKQRFMETEICGCWICCSYRL